jgi:hypothetical protein
MWYFSLQRTMVDSVQFDTYARPYVSQRHASWRAYVAERFPSVFAKLAAQLSQGSVTAVSDPTLAAEAESSASTQSEHTLSDSDAAQVRDKVLL